MIKMRYLQIMHGVYIIHFQLRVSERPLLFPLELHWRAEVKAALSLRPQKQLYFATLRSGKMFVM